MKLVLVSDTHCTKPELPSGDILIHAGDSLKSFTIKPYHGYDTRTGWDTYIVESKEFGGVLGFTDGPL